MSANPALLEVKQLHTWLASGDTVVRAVDGLSFTIEAGETFALLGESGSGKSITALSIMRLLPDAGRVVAGQVLMDGVDVLSLPEAAMRTVRGGRIAMIFQEPATSLNAVMRVGEQIGEVLERHIGLRGEAARRRALELLDAVRIPDAKQRIDEYPFQMSGGMKQRVMIAIALACNPALLIADEPTTALDVTIQAQVLELLRELQAKARMSVLLITHDLGVVAQMAHRVAVMYAGEIVELAPATSFFARPAHPYSKKLFEAVPDAAHRHGALAVIPGTVPALSQEFVGCRFADRCDFAWARCRAEAPAVIEIGAGHVVRCHLYDERDKTAAGRSATPAREGAATTIAPATTPAPLLAVDDLKVHFPIRRGIFKRVVAHVKAVDGVSLEISSGRTLALVGESGCGKTTVGKGILRLVPMTGGSVRFEGVDLGTLTPSALRPLRKDFQIVFQDPYSSLDPRMRVVEIV
ncbi:MAG TPA: oligopeptide/dipeptide ABC transporter ATP-binding protein, partial [Burkholderiales bacterium]|nr:oligopeptide/dipeptide ABC transporter ATP-binding protein [Burkholderiales bacterium]